MKRTTLILDERTFARVKQIAAEEGRTLSQVIDEMLRSSITQRRQRRINRRKGGRLPSFHMGTARVDVADREALYDFLDNNP